MCRIFFTAHASTIMECGKTIGVSGAHAMKLYVSVIKYFFKLTYSQYEKFPCINMIVNWNKSLITDSWSFGDAYLWRYLDNLKQIFLTGGILLELLLAKCLRKEKPGLVVVWSKDNSPKRPFVPRFGPTGVSCSANSCSTWEGHLQKTPTTNGGLDLTLGS